VATKTSEEVAAAFKRIITRARGRSRLRAVNEIPGEVSTDGGAEFKNAFEDLLEAEKIAHRFKESTNSLAVVDAAIRTLRTTIAKTMVDQSDDSWARALPLAVQAHNANSHPALMGSAPADVKGTPLLQYQLEKQAGEDMAVNTGIDRALMAKLRDLRGFRILLPKSTWKKADTPRYSEKVYEFLHVYGADVKATDGTTASLKNILVVPLEGSGDVQVPRELKPGRAIRDAPSQDALRPFAAALSGLLGHGGKLTLQGAGIKLRQIPNFAETMVAQKITGIGSLMRFLKLFPEFIVEGQPPRATVRLV
jgi:hypothetical protein